MAEFYIFLADDNEFPKWFILDKQFKGLLKVPLSYNKKGTNIFTYKKRKFAGEDDNYKFYLKEVAFTLTCVDESFTVALKLKCKLKPHIETKNYLKNITLYYDILVPIWHDFNAPTTQPVFQQRYIGSIV